MILKTGHAVRTAIASIVLILALSTACQDDTPFEGAGPGWDFLGLESLRDVSTRALLLDRPYLYVCAGRDGLYRGVVARPSPKWQYLGFADTSVVESEQAGALSGGAISNAIVGTGVRDVAIADNGDVLVATEYLQVVGSEATRLPQVYRSDDMGVSWQRSDSGMNLPSHSRGIRCLEASPCGDGTVFAASDIWFLRSLDGGISWTPIAALAELEDLQVHPKDCSVWAGGGASMIEKGSLFKSVDEGLSWEGVHPVLGEEDAWPYGFEVTRIALDPTDPNRLYVIIPYGGVNRTEDGGSIWTTPFFYSNKPAGAIVLDGSDPKHLFIGFGPVVHESSDGGETYEALEVPDGSDVLDMEYDTYGAALYVATGSGVYRYRTR